METETTTWPEFSNGRKAIVKQILASEEINKSKRPRIWESQSAILLGKLVIWVSFEILKLLQSSTVLSVPLDSQSLGWTLKSPKTNTADGLIDRT